MKTAAISEQKCHEYISAYTR